MSDRRNDYDFDEANAQDAEMLARMGEAFPLSYEKINGVRDEVYSKQEMDCMHFIGKLEEAAKFVRNDLKNENLKKIFHEAYDELAEAVAEKFG